MCSGMFEVYKNRNILQFALGRILKMMVQMYLACYIGGIFCTILGYTNMINLMCNLEMN